MYVCMYVYVYIYIYIYIGDLAVRPKEVLCYHNLQVNESKWKLS